MKPKEIICLINWVCFVVSCVAGLAFEQVNNTSHDVVRRVATDQSDPCLPSNHRNISHIGHRNINVRGSCPYTDGRLEDAWYYAGQNPISSYRHIPEMCSCGYKFPIWMNGTMPGVAEGVVSRTTCMRFGPFTCDQTINIQIKNCGHMFVYHLSATPDDAGYCFDVTTDSIISSISSSSTVSSTPTTSQTTATSTQDAETASSTSTDKPPTSTSSSMSSSYTTARNTEITSRTSLHTSISTLTPRVTATTSTENVTTDSIISSISSSSTVSSTPTTSQTTATSTQDAETASSSSTDKAPTSTSSSMSSSYTTARNTETTSTVETSPYYTKSSATVTKSPLQTASSSTEYATITSRTPPNTTTSALGTSSTNQTDTKSTDKNIEQKTTVATRPTSFPWWLSTTNSSGTKLQDAIFVNCNENGWNIRIDMISLREIYPNAKSSDIYLGENTCTGVHDLNTVKFQQGLKECLTSQTIRENMIVYSNQLIYAERDPKYQFIIRYYNWTVGVECAVQRNETSSGHIHHESNNLAHPTVTGNSHFFVNMSFYSDPNFMYQLQGNPLHVTVGDKVYVKIYATTSDWTVKMRVHTCYTKPSQHSPDYMKYYIIKNGCEVDTNTHMISQSAHETRFVFQDFEYTTSHEGIHVFCDAVFCESYDASRQCLQTCNPVIRRRNVDIKMTGTL